MTKQNIVLRLDAAPSRHTAPVVRDLFAAIKIPGTTREDPEQAKKAAIVGDKRLKLQFFRRRVVLFSAFEVALHTAAFLIQQAEFLDEPGGLMILAEGGCGKSFIGEQLALDFPRTESLYELHVPVVFITVPEDRDEKGLMVNLLSQLGERVGKNDFTAIELESKLIEAFRRVKCRCIFVDEAQRLDTTTKNRRQADRKMGSIGERLKTLYSKAGVAIILAGTPSLQELVLSDPQYKTRWSASVRLEPFAMGPEFQGVLNALAALVPLAGTTDFSRFEVASAIWTSCDGYFRRLKNLLCNALAIAIDESATSIAPHHLQQAYLRSSDFNKANPFDALLR